MFPRPHPWALGSFGVVLLATLAVRDGVFLRFPIFQFPHANGPAASPVFLAAGEPTDIEGFVDFFGIRPEDVDVRHEGYACSVQHRLFENQAWIAAHPGRAPGPVEVAVGLRIVSVDAEGRLQTELRIDARGTARAAP